MLTTKTDSEVARWRITDLVMRLRLWGKEQSRFLPSPVEGTTYTIGCDPSCSFQVPDDKGRVSRIHCRLTWEHGCWLMHDMSKNGTFVDGSRRAACVMEPGVELRVGKTTLIAESQLLIKLRAYLARIIGWSSTQIEAVDSALRSVRLAAFGRAALSLRGDGEIVALAEDIHEMTLGANKPFVLCDPRRKVSRATVRSAANYPTGLAALEAATGGTVCMWSKPKPKDYLDMEAALRTPEGRTQLIMCTRQAPEASKLTIAPITVPSLRTRTNEIARIISAYAEDAMASFSAQGTFATEDIESIAEQDAETLPQIRTATKRLVALRHCGENQTQAAELLGMTAQALSEWLENRNIRRRRRKKK